MFIQRISGMTCKSAIAAIGFSAALIAAPVSAATRSINISPNSLHVEAGTTVQPFNISVPATGTPSFVVHFVVPPDYVVGTNLALRVYGIGPSVCSAVLRVQTATVRRSGQSTFATGPTDTNWITSANGNVMTFPLPLQNVIKQYTIRSPALAGFSDLRVGDALTIRLQRLPADAQDTCTPSISLSHFEVRYTTP